MVTYVAMLRGINVSGQKLIKMADLRALLSDAKLLNVETYIQSGNIVFSSTNGQKSQLEELIHVHILDHYNFEVPVIIRTAKELQQVLDNNPFGDAALNDPKHLFVTFLSNNPAPDMVERINEYNFHPEQWEFVDTNIFFHSPDGYGKAKFNNNFIEQKLKVRATTRNWKTVNILAEMARENS